MRSPLTMVLLAGLIALAVFGAWGMHADMESHAGRCALAAFRGTACPMQVSSVEYVVFHLDALRSFSVATIGEGFAALLLLFALFIAGLSRKVTPKNIVSPELSRAPYRPKAELFAALPGRGILHWLALHENSPTVF